MSENLVSFTSLVSNSLGLFDLKVSILKEVGHSEPLINDSVDDEFVVVAPGLAQAIDLALLGLFV